MDYIDKNKNECIEKYNETLDISNYIDTDCKLKKISNINFFNYKSIYFDSIGTLLFNYKNFWQRMLLWN